jgi:nucleotide-binding universal stress UspA family protein
MAGSIVVGVDGSPPSVAALRFAAEEAELRNATLVAIHAWTYVSPAAIVDPGMIPVSEDYVGQLDAELDAAQTELDSAIAAAFPDGPPTGFTARVVEDSAGDALVAEAADAELLVVGSSGKSGLTSALLGSVSRHVVSHASCPVVVVKAAEREPG